MSEINVNKVAPSTGTNVTLGDASDTFKVPSGVTLDIESGATIDATGATVTGFPAGTTTTINNNADNRVITGSGTADTLNGEAGLIFDGSKLGIGTSTMTRTLNVTDTTASASTGIQLIGANDGTQFINFGDTDDSNVGEINYDHTTNKMLFRANDAYEMSIFNGVVGMGADAGNADQGSGLHIKVSDTGATAWTSANQLIVEKSGDNGITLLNSVSGESFLAFGDSDNNGAGMLAYHHSYNHMTLWTGGAERIRVDSAGRSIFGSTSPIENDANVSIYATSNYPLATKVGTTGSAAQLQCFNGNGQVGGITTSGTSTAFNTSSDYRLKENETPITDGITRLKTLKPYRFNFLADADKTVDGFFAHEVSSIVPEAIVGTKDELKTNKDGTNKLDDDGNTIPKHQGIDQSKLVPLLVASVQELIAENETLKNRITAVENA